MQPAMRLIVEVRALTGAGACGLTIVPGGKLRLIGRKQPPLVGISGSVSARTAQHAAASEPDGTQFICPLTCGLVPAKSNSIAPSATVAAISMRIGFSTAPPSLYGSATSRQ